MTYSHVFKKFVEDHADEFALGDAGHMYWCAAAYNLPDSERFQICYLCDELDIDVWAANRVHSFMFYRDIKIHRIVLPDNVTKIGVKAFAESSLKMITIPRACTIISPDAFQGCFLQLILYQGTIAELSQIKGSETALRGFTVKCSDGIAEVRG